MSCYEKRFKVGDRVVLSHHSWLKDGTIGTVINEMVSIYDDTKNMYLIVLDTHSKVIVYDHELSPLFEDFTVEL
jgi:hypothetical protein